MAREAASRRPNSSKAYWFLALEKPTRHTKRKPAHWQVGHILVFERGIPAHLYYQYYFSAKATGPEEFETIQGPGRLKACANQTY